MDKNETELIYFLVICTALLSFLSILVLNLLLLNRNRKLKHTAALLEAKAAFERELISTRLEVTEATLEEVSADLHDDVGQMLTVAILELNRLEGAGEAKAAVKSGLESVRAISRSLSAEFMQSVGLQEALQRMADRINKQGFVKVTLQLDDTVVWAEQNHALYVFRILQELVTNTLKYAQASQIHIAIARSDKQVLIDFRDNGKGLDDNISSPGMGLLNVRRRVSVLNGTIEIHSKPGTGFSAKIVLPES